MKLQAKVGERGQVVIPKAIRDKYTLGKGSTIEFEDKGKGIYLRPKKDMTAIRNHLDKYRGFLAGSLEADGFGSVDHYIDEIRGRDADYKRIMSIEE